MAGQALAHSWGPSGCERGLPLLTCVELAAQLCRPIHPGCHGCPASDSPLWLYVRILGSWLKTQLPTCPISGTQISGMGPGMRSMCRWSCRDPLRGKPPPSACRAASSEQCGDSDSITGPLFSVGRWRHSLN